MLSGSAIALNDNKKYSNKKATAVFEYADPKLREKHMHSHAKDGAPSREKKQAGEGRWYLCYYDQKKEEVRTMSDQRNVINTLPCDITKT